MTREIKFRIWDKDNNKMLNYNNDIVPCLTLNGVLQDCSKEVSSNISYKYDLMQFTGLHDKNGKEIWEGDIIKVGSKNWFDKGYTSNEEVSIGIDGVRFGKIKPFSKMYQGEVSGQEENHYDTFEVIGNVYENKNLLN